MIVDSSTNNMALLDPILFYSPDGDKVAGTYVNSDQQTIVFEYQPKSNQIAKTNLKNLLSTVYMSMK